MPSARPARGWWAPVLAFGLACVCLDASGQHPTREHGVKITRLVESGGRVSVHRASGTIAFDRLGLDLFYEVWTHPLQPRPVTLGRLDVPQMMNGQPAWHPSGRWLVFQSQNPALLGLRFLGAAAEGVLTNPGAGLQNNLWVIEADGSRAVPLTDVPDLGGVLHPHFSPDGTRLFWAEHLPRAPGRPTNHWVLRLARFVGDPGPPQLEAIQTFRPGNLGFYESHGFSPDGERLLYSAAPADDFFALELYTLQLDGPGGAPPVAQRLTQDDEWDEHAHLSPCGRFLVWASSRGIPQPRTGATALLDYWIARSDGTRARRLTFFNQPGAPEHEPDGAIASDFDWLPNGQGVVAFVQILSRRATSPIFLIQFDPAGPRAGPKRR